MKLWRHKIASAFSRLVFFAILFFPVSCAQVDERAPQAKTEPPAQSQSGEDSPPDSIISTGYKNNIDPPIFEAAFVSGTKITDFDVNYTFEILDIGKLKCESGKIIAVDPIRMNGAVSFSQEFPKGEFPVQVAIANEEGHNDGDEAFCRVVFSGEPVAKWEVALQPGEKKTGIHDSDTYCFGNDAAIGIFIDSAANKVFPEQSEADWNRIFMDGLKSHGDHAYIYNFPGHNFAIYHTGAGDGCYPCYIGYDKNGKPCRLLCDFGIIDW